MRERFRLGSIGGRGALIAFLLFAPAIVGIVVTLVLVGGGTDEPVPSTPTLSPTLATDLQTALGQVQNAIDRQDSYTVTVVGHNLVLPQWGGAELGTVKVAKRGAEAWATLGRTGEQNATYAITLVDGQTFFKRSTCNETFRVPGGSGAVLGPFLLHTTLSLLNAQSPVRTTSGFEATFDTIGHVRIEIDPRTNLPARIYRAGVGESLDWLFSDWGKTTVDVSAPSNVQDRGPGGDPC